MKKILAALAVAALASTASALAPAHDLTTQGGTNGSCQYCHAPHLWNPVDAVFAGVAPLWNRAAPGATTPYTSSTLSGTIVVGPNSLTCLTCHDGITNLGAINNGGIVGDLAAPLATAVVGLDLTDDHPVGVPLVAVAGAYQLPTLTRLYTSNLADRVECASCHEPRAALRRLPPEVGSSLVSRGGDRASGPRFRFPSGLALHPGALASDASLRRHAVPRRWRPR